MEDREIEAVSSKGGENGGEQESEEKGKGKGKGKSSNGASKINHLI